MNLAKLFPEDAIGPYVIEKELGRGALGIAYLAWDTEGKRDVVLKHAVDPGEVQALQKLSQYPHCTPFLLCLYDTIQYDDREYVVLEYIPGQVLADIEPQAEKLWVILGQLLEALVSIHSQGYAHDDIHDRNVMWTGSEVKLIDFGYAKEYPPGSVKYKFDVGYTLYYTMDSVGVPSLRTAARSLETGKHLATYQDYRNYLQSHGTPLDDVREKMIQMYLAYQEMSEDPDPEHLAMKLLEVYRGLDASARFDEGDARFDEGDARFDEGDARFDEGDARFDASARLDGGDEGEAISSEAAW